MSEESRCCFCLRLPPLRGRRVRAGAAARCPVCRGQLLRTIDQTYRVEDCPAAEETRPRRRLSSGAYALGGVIALVAIGGLGVTVAHSTTTSLNPPAGELITQAAAGFAQPSPVGEMAGPRKEDPAPRQELPPAPAPGTTVAEEPPIAHAPAVTVATVPPRPAARPPDPLPATAVSVSPRGPDQEPGAPSPPVRAASLPFEGSYTIGALTEMLQRIPELSLLTAPPEPRGSGASAARGTRAAWLDLERMVRGHQERYLDSLLAKRPDLADLPFRRGEDCQLNRAAAQALDVSSRQVRTALAAASDRTARPPGPAAAFAEPEAAAVFQVYHEVGPRLGRSGVVPVLEQVLTGESPRLALGLAQYLQYPVESVAAASVLARRAVFDTSVEVRRTAIAGLRVLPARDYIPALLGGLRYPWPPANYHAAEALVALGAETAVADLLRVLDAPDPCAPFEHDEGGKQVLAIRELVRVNHHGNGLLCHAPSFAPGDLVRSPVPSPLAPLPPVRAYYGSSRGSGSDLFVRADVTYLRQDFSEVLPVADAGPWPKRQRFDFLVRVRRLAEGEADAWRNRPAGPPPLPASRQAVLFALRQLTGLDSGFTAASWEEALSTRHRPAGSK